MLWNCKRCGSCCIKLPKRLQLLNDEVEFFPKYSYENYLAGGFSKSDLKPIVYKLKKKRCPMYDEKVGCTIYENRPIVCKAFPVIINSLDGYCKNVKYEQGYSVPSELIVYAEERSKKFALLINNIRENNMKLWVYKNSKWRIGNKKDLLKLFKLPKEFK